jgi:PAS domain S-box-containing protein
MKESTGMGEARDRALEENPAMSDAEAEHILSELASVFYSADPASRASLADPAHGASATEVAHERSLDARYRTLVEQICAVVFMAFLDKGISEAYVSPQIEAILGFTQQEWLHDPVRWYRQIHPDDRERWSVEAAAMFLSGRPLRSVYRVLARDGRVVWFDCDVKMVRRADGRPWFIHGVGFDITELKEAEEALRRARDELEERVRQRTAELAGANRKLREEIAERERAEQERARLLEREQAARYEAEAANRAKDEFLATVSHELRTPLNAMLGWVRLLRSGRLEQEAFERGLQTVERNTLAQAQLIEDLLDVSRIVSGKLRLTVETVDLEKVIHAAVESVEIAAEGKGVRLQTVAESAAGVVLGDRTRLQQVVWNLLSNAIKFTPNGGKVLIRLTRVDSSVEITVEDTGPGISPEFLPHVFERFRQADGAITRKHGGLGLGLAIVKHLVEMHGGVVRAESEGEGKGAAFVVRLPVTPVRRESAKAPARPVLDGRRSGFECPSSLAGVRVLVVDDEADTREMLELVLGECEAEVHSVGSASEALSVLDEWDAEILVSDIGMPDEDGHELIRQVRARPASRGGAVPAVALTAYARFEDRMRALAAGFQMHVAKPVEPAELVMVIHSLLEFKGKVLPSNDSEPSV